MFDVGVWLQFVVGQVVVEVFDLVYLGFGVGCVVDGLYLYEGFIVVFYQVVVQLVWLWFVVLWCDGFVDFGDGVVMEQVLVGFVFGCVYVEDD